MKVTEDIYRPQLVGQYQHGSARWLKEKERKRVFTHQMIDPNNHILQILLKTGYNDLEFLNQQKEVEEKIQEQQEIRQSGDEKGVSTLPISIKEQQRKEKIEQDEYFESVEFDIAKEIMKKGKDLLR